MVVYRGTRRGSIVLSDLGRQAGNSCQRKFAFAPKYSSTFTGAHFVFSRLKHVSNIFMIEIYLNIYLLRVVSLWLVQLNFCACGYGWIYWSVQCVRFGCQK
eukprot:TRINITY_DN23791_c0_g1_i2.p11 TRINITY_DN23791_c0_g1~~TRINITY_DN23791_c0_g1_i2.p11  ORF type:complete len:101 (+),score=3.76 TRINITY_DN23791_c0_g1_i2:1295-1597(+)